MKNKPDYREFSAWEDAKFTISGLLALLFPLILLGLIWLALF